MKRMLWVLAVSLPLLARGAAPQRSVTFISTSDPHYREVSHKLGHHNGLNRASIEEMNRLTNIDWPRQLGGGPVAAPRGVVVLGDLIDPARGPAADF